MNHSIITNATHPLRQPLTAAWCDSFLSRLKGLMFAPPISKGEGIILVQPSEDRINAAIHMLFMNFDLAVIWVNHDLKVVDKVYARKWRLAYSPAKPAQYVLELHTSRLDDFIVGDQLVYEKCVD